MAQEVSSTGSGDAFEVERGLLRTSRGYIHYRAAGSGRPILMIHTAHRSSEMFLPIMRFLADEYRCYALDLPGCGFSDHLKEKVTMEDYIASVHEVVHALDLRDLVAMGQALGVNLCAELAATEPDRVRGLILQSFPFYPSRENAEERHALRRDTLRVDESGFPQLLTLREVLDRGAGDVLNRPRNPTQEWVDEENREMVMAGRTLWDGLAAARRFDRGSFYELVACPTLLIWGRDFLYSRHSGEVARRIKNHRLILIPDADFFVHLDQPDRYREAVTSFLRDLS